LLNSAGFTLSAHSDPSAAQPGAFLSLEALKRLPLGQEARLALLEELRSNAESGLTRAQLTGEEAELRLRCCEDAFTSGQWLEAFQHHDALLELVVGLAQALPAQAAAFWARYGELLAALTAAVHGAVNSNSADPPPDALRAEVCWRLAERLKLGHELPFEPPDWLAVLEQQLVQDGAAYWSALIEGPGLDAAAADLQQARRRAFALLLRMDRLLAPAPSWVLQQARGHLEAEAQLLLSSANPAPADLVWLCASLEAWPLEAKQVPHRDGLLTRARLTLELIDPELAPLTAQPSAAGATPVTVQEPEPGLAELVLLEAEQIASPLQLDLAPLLTAEFEAIEAALDDFVWHLPRGSRALAAAPALLAVLEPAWSEGVRFSAGAFERLAYLAAAWQRRLADRLDPPPTLDWQYSLLIELDSSELAVLQPLLANPESLEPVLAELRREHHNPPFWEQRQELPWMQCPSPLEALRRLHLEHGYYARASAPLDELAQWGEEITHTLLSAELWTDDAGCLGRWLAVAQELVAGGKGSCPPFGQPPAPDQLLREWAGLEVVYVGDQAEAVQAAHRAGRCFRGDPFGLRVLPTPASRWPARPAGSFRESLQLLLDAVDGLYSQRPFAVLLADCGAYRLPLMRAVHQRYGVAALSSGRPLAAWLGA
jgi:hypothetical protein